MSSVFFIPPPSHIFFHMSQRHWNPEPDDSTSKQQSCSQQRYKAKQTRLKHQSALISFNCINHHISLFLPLSFKIKLFSREDFYFSNLLFLEVFLN